MQEALAKVRKRIGDLGWDILQERLTQDKPRTLEELGQRWGVSRERVRQVELKTKNFLARYLSAFNQDEEHWRPGRGRRGLSRRRHLRRPAGVPGAVRRS